MSRFIVGVFAICMIVCGNAKAVIYAPSLGGGFNAYELISGSFTWDEARVDAMSQSFMGVSGHLATVHSATENTAINGLGSGDRWIGLTDSGETSGLDSAVMPGSEGTFAWITGEAVGYTNWAGPEPNDVGGEDAAHLRSNGEWNDDDAGSTLGDDNHTLAYIVEYELGLAEAPMGGWTVNIQTVDGGGSDGDLSHVDEAIDLIVNGGDLEAMDMPFVINYPDNGFPVGTTEEQFAMHAFGFIDVLDPSGEDEVSFYVNSDDGFRLLINGIVVSEFNDPTGGSNTLSAPFMVHDGDFIELYYYERGGGEFVLLQRDVSGDRNLIGDEASGILITKRPVPEPATAGLAVLAVAAFGLRRRRA